MANPPQDDAVRFRPVSHPPTAADRQAPCSLTGAIVVQMIPASKIRPNGYNPNRMARAERRQLRKEIRRLGRIAKPLVVRRCGDSYLLIDGEHSFKAGLREGLTDFPAEVAGDIDDFESMRQTLMRNKHGESDPVRLGRVYLKMMRPRALGKRAIARVLGVSEGTIRNKLLYLKAARLRIRYARANGEKASSAALEIAALKTRQVREYLKRPDRDAWLDSGGEGEPIREVDQEPANGEANNLHHSDLQSIVAETDMEAPLSSQGIGQPEQPEQDESTGVTAALQGESIDLGGTRCQATGSDADSAQQEEQDQDDDVREGVAAEPNEGEDEEGPAFNGEIKITRGTARIKADLLKQVSKIDGSQRLLVAHSWDARTRHALSRQVVVLLIPELDDRWMPGKEGRQ